MFRSVVRKVDALASSFRPLGNLILVERTMAENKTASGLMLPEKNGGKAFGGTVIAVGPGARNSEGKLIPMQVKVGDQLLLPAYGATAIQFEGKEHAIFRESDVLGKFE